MPIFALGLNHTTAPLSLREKVAVAPARLAEVLQSLMQTNGVREAAILSTCNRTEVYCSAQTAEPAVQWLAHYHDLAPQDIVPHLYTHEQDAAIRHVFRVASGLDSMVLGEAQILGQMKQAIRIAQEVGTLGGTLHKLFQSGFSIAKEVRTQTEIGANVISMAAASVKLVEQIFETMSKTHVLFVGAGEMIELCAAHFAAVEPQSMTIANRTDSRAHALAERFNAKVMPLAHIGENLAQFDVVVSCTASPTPIIGLGAVESALRARRQRPMVLVDLAVPRDFETEITELSDVFLYTIDDLAQIVNTGRQARQAAVEDAEVLVSKGVENFLRWVEQRDVVPVIRSVREHAEALRQAELERAIKLLERGEDPRAVLQNLSQGLTNKLIHRPTQFLNQAQGIQLEQGVDLITQMFVSPDKQS